MKILLTGKDGQLGWELERTLQTLGSVHAFDRNSLDLSSADQIRSTIGDVQPTLIINAAAYTAVDKAESDQSQAMLINATAPAIMAEEAKKIGAALIHYSTDYVFDGNDSSPYLETDQTSPVNVYGETKLAGENAISNAEIPYLILRTSWVYAARGENFLLTMLRLMHERNSLSIVSDQHGAPTWSRTIAEATGQMIAQLVKNNPTDLSTFKQYSGIYHLTAQGETSWYEFALSILNRAAVLQDQQNKIRISPIPSSEYPVPAKRPSNSTLSLDKIEQTFGLKLPHWENALALCLKDYELR